MAMANRRGRMVKLPSLLFPATKEKAAMTHDGKDGVWVAWIDNRLATIGLYIQEIDGSGNRLQGKTGRLVADKLNKPSRPQLVPLGTGNPPLYGPIDLKRANGHSFGPSSNRPRPSSRFDIIIVDAYHSRCFI